MNRRNDKGRRSSRRALANLGGEVEVKGERSAGRALGRAFGIDVSSETARRHVHGFHSYPARLHPDLARSFIDVFAPAGVLDPFCGSGTVLVEARLGARACWGYDLNPLAVRIARLKARGATKRELSDLLDDARNVSELARQRRRTKAGATRQYGKEDTEMFSPHVLLELDSLRYGLERLDPGFGTEALWLALSSMLTKVSNQRGDTGRHDPQRRLPAGFTTDFFEKRVEEMVRQIRTFTKLLPRDAPRATISVADARKLAHLPHAQVSLLLTSPPYPGNYDYLRHHAARLRWLGLPSEPFEQGEMGARRHLDKLSPQQAQQEFERDLTQVLQGARSSLVPGGLAVLVIADSVASRQVVWAEPVVKNAATHAGYRWLATASQQRPHFHKSTRSAFKGRPRHEHAILLQAENFDRQAVTSSQSPKPNE